MNNEKRADVIDGGDWAGRGRVDLYATGLSTLCLIHCLALPLLASMLPLAGPLSEDAVVHRVLVLLAAPATLWAGWKSLHIESSWPFLITGAGGLVLLMAAAFLNAVAPYEQPITVTGALLLASAHLYRWTRHRHGASLRDEFTESDE